jgi:hypothetical protein
MNMYRLKIRGQKEQIYFFPDRDSHSPYGFTPIFGPKKGKDKI